MYRPTYRQTAIVVNREVRFAGDNKSKTKIKLLKPSLKKQNKIPLRFNFVFCSLCVCVKCNNVKEFSSLCHNIVRSDGPLMLVMPQKI